jgi:hypothetical protein
MTSPTPTPTPAPAPATPTEQQRAAWRAAAELYHAWFIGTVLFTVSRLGAPAAQDLVHEIFSRQRRERFLPGLQKLGIDHLPPAVAAAQYHYLSNHIGGVHVEYMPESDRKAWIRYAPPRWAWAGTALCGIPPGVSTAMLWGWHAQNGVMLGNLRLGFVCTKQTVDGQSGLEGYYLEHDHDLQPQERLRFARHEDSPDFDPALAPRLPTGDWPEARLAKAHRGYAVEYMRSAFAAALALWGPVEAVHRLGLAGRLIGLQFYQQTAAAMGGPYPPDAAGFAMFLADVARAQGDDATVHGDASAAVVTQHGWNFRSGIRDWMPELATAWNGVFEGALQAHDRRLSMQFGAEDGGGAPVLTWTIRRRG